MSASARPTIGLIAGQGTLPLLVAQGIRAAGCRVAAVGLHGQYEPGLRDACDEFAEAGVLQLGKWIRLMRRFHAQRAVIIGRVGKARMHDPWRLLRQLPDLRAIDLWYRRLRHDHRTAALLAAVADELTNSGVTIIDSTTYITAHLATTGQMGRVAAAAQQLADIQFGWPLLAQLASSNIGQALTVREGDVIAVEAVEGTDAMIERTGQLCPKRGWVLLKTASPGHDMRADVPTIGVQTIERLASAGGKAISLGAGRVILADREAVIAAADRLGVALIGIA